MNDKTKWVREDFSDFVQVQVRWGDMDALGHVNNAVFFSYFEMARIFHFEKIGMVNCWTNQIGPILKSISAVFIRPVLYPATLWIGTRASAPQLSEYELHYGAFFGESGEIAAIGKSQVVWVDYHKSQRLPLPEVIRQALGE